MALPAPSSIPCTITIQPSPHITTTNNIFCTCYHLPYSVNNLHNNEIGLAYRLLVYHLECRIPNYQRGPELKQLEIHRSLIVQVRLKEKSYKELHKVTPTCAHRKFGYFLIRKSFWTLNSINQITKTSTTHYTNSWSILCVVF